MNNFTKGILVGVGASLLFAPLSGKETRRLIKERYDEWQRSLPEDSRINQYTREINERVSQAKGNLQRTVTRVKDTSNTLGDRAQRSAQQIRQAGQDVASRGRQAADTAAGRSTSSSHTRITPETNPRPLGQE